MPPHCKLLHTQAPYDVACGHPAFKQFNALTFAIYANNKNSMVTSLLAAELNNIIEIFALSSKLFHSADPQDQVKLAHLNFPISMTCISCLANQWNHALRFPAYDMQSETWAFPQNCLPIHADFGIQPKHLGSAVHVESIECKPLHQWFFNTALWKAVEEQCTQPKSQSTSLGRPNNKKHCFENTSMASGSSQSTNNNTINNSNNDVDMEQEEVAGLSESEKGAATPSKAGTMDTPKSRKQLEEKKATEKATATPKK
ncbi:hypothetical protein DFP72DRAFT_1083002 [Ephemerocybe angulata]|uniref:Uncharacterized protein n=1 Tax=Ephemerocybe angulata TaxID=980116 RepID=A0A8H6H979_9AGAR|nr:hypothetical protein DFP72DRAFT_1083002 [Tulosesus angulatus]